MGSKTQGERIAEVVYYLDEGETLASMEGKRRELAKRIDMAILRAKKKPAKKGAKR